MDIQHLIDRLERILNESRRLPLTASLIVDEDRIFTVLDQMRVAIPEAVKRANRIEAERERILAQAKEEAERIRELARQEAMDLVNRDTIIANATSRADNIVEHAFHETDRLRRDADQYVADSLGQLEADMIRSLSVIRNGLHRLHNDLDAPEAVAVEENVSAETPAPSPAIPAEQTTE